MQGHRDRVRYLHGADLVIRVLLGAVYHLLQGPGEVGFLEVAGSDGFAGGRRDTPVIDAGHILSLKQIQCHRLTHLSISLSY